MNNIKFNIILKTCFKIAILIACCGGDTANGSSSNSIFIVPQSNKSLICNIDNNKIIEIGSVPENIDSKCIVVDDKYICCINSSISIYDIKGILIKKLIVDFNPKSLNSKNKFVYLGGISNEGRANPGEIFAMIDLNDNNFTLNEIKLPIKIFNGKAIDDVLIINDKLILVDNIVYPKFLLEYNISDPGKPKHIITKNLGSNGTYEHIVKGDINNNWMVLLSSTVGERGSFDHIVIEGKTEGYIISKGGFYISDESFDDICLVNNLLYILVKDNAYSIDLEKTISRDAMNKIKTRLKSVKKIIRSPCNRIILIGKNDGYELR